MKKYFFWLPNSLTASRILVTPFLCVVAFQQYQPFYSWLPYFLIFLFLTDYADGYFSRKWDIVSEFGIVLDPIADKILVVILLFVAASINLLTVTGYVTAVIIIMRELTISGIREYVSYYGHKIPSSRIAKFKTAIQMVALVFIFTELKLDIGDMTIQFSEFLLVCAAIVSVISGGQYGYKAYQFLSNR